MFKGHGYGWMAAFCVSATVLVLDPNIAIWKLLVTSLLLELAMRATTLQVQRDTNVQTKEHH